MEIYLDNSATTRVFPEVVDVMNEIYLNNYGNPSSKHQKGLDSETALKHAKDIIANNLKCQAKEILFTSGGTESDNTALIGAVRAGKRRGNHVITTKIEHPAILETCKYLEENGCRVTYLSTDSVGHIDLDELKAAVNEETVIVSIMHTNNEIGTVQPIKEASDIIKSVNSKTLFHVDAVQGYGKYKIIPKKLGIDLMSVSGHKLHGPKGVGFLYINEKARIMPYIYGGGQQLGMRSGTENVPGIAGMAKAIEMVYDNLENDVQKLYALKMRLIDGVKDIPNIKLNGIAQMNEEAVLASAPHIVSLSVKDVRAEVLLHALEEKGIYVSSGSACASNKNSLSGTLGAINLSREFLDSTIRLSMSVYNTEQEIDATINALKDIIPELRKYTRH